MANKDRHKIVAVFDAFLDSLSISLSFSLVCPYFLVFHAIWEPQNSPPHEVTGTNINSQRHDIHLHILVVRSLLDSCFQESRHKTGLPSSFASSMSDSVVSRRCLGTQKTVRLTTRPLSLSRRCAEVVQLCSHVWDGELPTCSPLLISLQQTNR